MNVISLITRVLAILAGIAAVVFGYLTMNKVDDITDKFNRETSAHNATKAAKLEVEDELNTAQNHLKTAEGQVSKYKREAADIKGDLKAARSKLVVLEKDNEAKEKEVAQKDQQIQRLRDDLIAARNDVPQIDSRELDLLQDRIDDLEMKLRTAQDEVASFDQRVLDAVLEERSKWNPTEEIRLPSSIVSVNLPNGMVTVSYSGDQQLVKNQIYTLSANGRRVARVQIHQANGSQYVANILPGYGVPGMLLPTNNAELIRGVN